MDTKNLPLIAAIIILVLAGGILTYVMTRPTPVAAPTGETPADTSNLSGTTSKNVADHGQYYDITAVTPAATPLRASAGADADTKAVAVMDKWIADTISSFKSDSGLASLTPEDIKMMGLDQGRKYTLDIKYEAHESPSTVSYVFSVFEDTLGAHPNAFYQTFTFDKTSGDVLSLDDLFLPGTKYLQYLSDTSRASLRTQIAKASQIKESEVDSDMLNAGTGPNSESFQWFYLDGSNLVLVFPPYSVGPWVIGTQTVTLPVSSLSSYLKFEFGDQTKG